MIAMGDIENRGSGEFVISARMPSPEGWHTVRQTLIYPQDMDEAEQLRRATDELNALEKRIAGGAMTEDMTPPTTVTDFYEIWMEQYCRRQMKPTTIKNYEFFFTSRILPAFGDMALDAVRPLDVVAWVNDLRMTAKKTTRLPDTKLKRPRTPSDQAKMSAKKDAPLSDRTVRHYFDALSTMYDKAVQWEVCERNPCTKAGRPKAVKRTAHFLSEERAIELIGCLRDEPNRCYRIAVLLGLLCGLRLGEVGALTLDDIDWEEGTIDISKALNYSPDEGSYEADPKTAAGRRIVTLPASMMDMLREERQYQAEASVLAKGFWVNSRHLLHADNGAALHHDTPSRWFRKFADSHGFEGIRFHDLRHTHATILIANNIDVVEVAGRLGHEDANTTLKIYAHALARRDKDAAAAVEQIFAPALDKLPRGQTPLDQLKLYGYDSIEQFIEETTWR